MRNSTDSRCGQAALMMTLSLTVILGMLGLAVDLGWAYYRQQAAQAAADAGAAATVRAAVNFDPTGPSCANSVWCSATASNCPSSAPGSATNTFNSACMLAAANGFTTSGIDTVSVQAGTGSPPSVPAVSTSYWATVRVSEALPALFGAAFARGGLTPGAIATAGAISNPGSGSCVYILDPSGEYAFEAANGASVQIGCGIYVDSNNATAAMYVTGGASVTASFIDVVGTFLKNNGGTTSVTPSTGVSSVPDPFVNLPAPTIAPSCQSGNFTAWQASPYTPAPGTYCGFSVGNGMSLQMSGGIYVIDGGTFSIQGGSTVTTTGGVLIYLTNGATVNIGNGATVTLSAQTSGTYQGVLFYQDRTMASPGASTFQGGASMNLTGTLYFPHATLDINNGSGTSGTSMAIVSDMVNFQGGAHLLADAGGTHTGLSSGFTVSMIQ